MFNSNLLRQAREAINAYKAAGLLSESRRAALNNQMVYDFESLKSDDVAKADFQKVLDWTTVPEYSYALGELLKYIGPIISSPVVTPEPTIVIPPELPAVSVSVSADSLSPTEISILRDLSYVARTVYAPEWSGVLYDRLMAMSRVLKEGTYKTWIDSERGELLGMLAETPDGRYGPNREIIDHFATVIGVTVGGGASPIIDSGTTPSPVVITPTPTPPSTPTPGTGVLPPSFQWPDASNNYAAPAGSGGPSGRPAESNIQRNGMLFFGNDSPAGTTATSGPNGQVIGIGGRSKGKIRVNTRGGAGGDGGMRDMTNYVDLQERPGQGTISRRGFDLFCSIPDALSINTAVWTTNPDGKRDGGDFVTKRISATHFIGNWSNPAYDYESRPFVISGADQPDKDRFSTKSGADSNAGYGWRVDKPRNSTEAHANYANGGYSDGGDFLLRLHHNSGQDIGRYSRFMTYNEGRGIAFATSDGTYSICPDALVIEPGHSGLAGDVNIPGNLTGPTIDSLRAEIAALKAKLP